MTLAPPTSLQPQGLDIGRLALGVLRQWPIVLGMLLLGTVLGYGLKHILTPSYTSSVSLLIDPKRPGAVGSDGQFTNLYVDSAKVGSVVSIIESSGLLSHVVRSEKLADNPEFGDAVPSFTQKWLAFLPFVSVPPIVNTPEAREARALEQLSRAISTTRVNYTYVIRVEVTAHKPADAQRLAAAVVSAYLNDQVDTKYQAARRDSIWLAERLNDLRGELIRSEEAVETIRRKYGLTETNQGPNTTTDRQKITDLNAQVTQAQAEVAARQAKYEQVQRIRRGNGSLESLPEVTTSQTIHDLRRAQSEVNRKIADLSAHYTASFPGLIDAQRDKRALDSQLNAEVTRIAESLRNDYETAVARRDELAKMMAGLVEIAAGNTSSEGRVQLREAQRVVDANRAFYDAQLSRLREVEQQETRQDVEARVISPAYYPGSPKFPRTVLLLGGGAAIGLMIGLGIAILRSMLENRFVTVTWMEDTLALPVLGTLPMLKRRDLAVKGRRVSIVHYLRLKPLSRFAEALRALRTGLRHASTALPRVIHVTSAVPGEGKSTVAAALAISAAVAGQRTVLVDLDIRNASVSNLFNLPTSEGVTDVLQGGSKIGTALQTYSKLPLTVIAAGSPARPRPETLDSPLFGAMVRELARDFELVVLDSPPILAVSDAALIANVADVTLLVVQWRTTPREIVRQAVKVLRSNRAPLAGVVMNKIDFSKMHQYEGPGYSSYYEGMSDYVSS